MSGEIKLDSFNRSSLGADKVPDASHPAGQSLHNQSSDEQADGVTVTNHLNKLVTLLTTPDESGANENSAVNAMRHKILTNQYNVDFNALSDKLINSGVLTTLGE